MKDVIGLMCLVPELRSSCSHLFLQFYCRLLYWLLLMVDDTVIPIYIFIKNIIIDCTSLIYWQLLLKVYFTGNITIYIQTNCSGGLCNCMTFSIFPCCYYGHSMFVFHIVNHCNCYAPCGSLIGQESILLLHTQI